ncbi:mevalonate kinase [Haliangium ochraceum]|uniref:mevalonate kinase n=1 Tax=Haliangium ochraceum (strain DSM 14365 / JCM 11303 / SMP-2) TaxID=502025 RepID=D0LV70_HALO1|nr:mevalonate kinase [Haliangium ochraceum]ACY15911.1 mevalonate kinase [Haliangium ochraceum DSM 14365]
MTWAFGKAILLGEHAVVYGQPALAGAIDATVRCQWQPGAVARAGQYTAEGRGRALRVLAPAWQVELVLGPQDVSDAAVVAGNPPHGDLTHAVAVLVHALGIHRNVDVLSEIGPGTMFVDAALPAAAGLGSSAALAVALTRALAEAIGHPLGDSEVEALAGHAERCFHDNPSGVDVALACRGGLGLYRRGHGLDPVDAAPLRLAVGLSGVPRSTSAMVARVATAWEAMRERVDSQLAALGRAALRGTEAVLRGDLPTLGALMDEAQTILADIGVSTPELERLCSLARDAGALGAKLTGAGGGGAVIALLGTGPGASADASADADADAVVAAWRAAGFPGFTCNLGQRP